jgi:hypothetical protein
MTTVPGRPINGSAMQFRIVLTCKENHGIRATVWLSTHVIIAASSTSWDGPLRDSCAD